MVSFVPIATEDGSYTFFSENFQEAFHSRYGARQEAIYKFVRPARLAERARDRDRLCLLDICYGLGYNTAAALEAIWRSNPACRVCWMGLERDAAVPEASLHHGLLDGWMPPIPDLLAAIAAEKTCETPQLQARLWLGDARQTIAEVDRLGFRADAIFLDPFSPQKCPQLWTLDFLQRVFRCLKPDGYLVTYSAAAAVRNAAIALGVRVGSTPPIGRKAPGTVARWLPDDLPTLSQMEREHLQTRAACVYRDRTLTASARDILQQRDLVQQTSSLEPTSQWRKRWTNGKLH